MRGQQTEADRIAELERDPQCQQFDAHRCLCAACGRWVHLSGRAHKIFNWRRHKKGCTLQKARGAGITIIQSNKSPQQLRAQGVESGAPFNFRTRDEVDGMEVDEELLDGDSERRSAYAHSDDGYYDTPPSPRSQRYSASNGRNGDKRYLQLPSITTFALSPTGSTSTPPLTSSDAASSTTTSESGHSLISSWSQVPPTTGQVAYGHSQGPEMGSWGRASHRARGASTSSFRSLPPLSAASSATATSLAGSPQTTSKFHFRSRGGPGSGVALVECEGCQTVLESGEWSSHKRSCRAYGRYLQQLDSREGPFGAHGYHHSHSLSQPVAHLPPLITTTSPISEVSHSGMMLGHSSSPGSTPKLSTSRSESRLHRHETPRLSIDTSFSRSGSGTHSGGGHSLIDAALGGDSSTTLTAHLDRSHISRYDLGRGTNRSGSYDGRHEASSGLGLVSGRRGEGSSHSRSPSHVDLTHSPTSTKSGSGSVYSSGRASLKIADLCHPSHTTSSPPPGRSPDSERGVSVSASASASYRSASSYGRRRSRSSSPNPYRARSWSRAREDRHTYTGARYPPRPVPRHQSSEDNSTTPTHTPLIRTTLSAVSSGFSRGRVALSTYDIDSDDEGSSGSSDIRAVQYNYSQSRSTFQSEFDSEDGGEFEKVPVPTSRGYPFRSLSPPSPYISDA